MARKEEEYFCSDYLVLKAEEATLLELIYLLFSRDVKIRPFVECPEGKRFEDLSRRWLIFVSVIFQKVLLFFAKPLALIGSMFEMWLNLLSSNRGLNNLLLNLLKGKVEKPDKSSATFASVVANIDKRVGLDKSIKHGSNKYNPSLCIMASKLSYENEAFIHTTVKDHWKMELLGFYNFWNDHVEQFSTQAFMFHDIGADPDMIVVAFRGTGPFDSNGWRTDVDISWYKLENVGKVHSGFMKALGQPKNKGWPKDNPEGLPLAYYTIREKLRDLLHKNERAKLMLTGHSLGGALAILFVAVLALHEETWLMEKLEGVYTFGQPRVGDKQFGEFMKKKLRLHDLKYFRYVYCSDMVPRLPCDDKTLMFKHFGTCLFFNSCYKGKIVSEEPDKNYFSVFWAIPKNLNAVWELTRSFIVPYTKGPDYKEGWFLTMFRVIGLAIPGLPAHFPQDYVNATRLGSLPSPLRLQHSDEGVKFD